MKFICKKYMAVYEIKLDNYANMINLKRHYLNTKNNRIGG